MSIGISLHIGMNTVDIKSSHYSKYTDEQVSLGRCENDARAMEKIAENAGFSCRTILLTKRATYNQVVNELKRAASLLDAGDLFMLTFSGHGMTVEDHNGDERKKYDDMPDEKDESWLLYDRALVDDELCNILSRFNKGVRIILISDSCLSGGMLDNDNGIKMKASIILIAATSEIGITRPGGNPNHGELTHNLYQIWESGSFTTYEAMYAELKKRMSKDRPPVIKAWGEKTEIEKFVKELPFEIQSSRLTSRKQPRIDINE